jgi:uncharacterized protein
VVSDRIELSGRPDLAVVVGGFGDLVHRAGVPVTPERSGRLLSAIAAAAPRTVDELYWLARVTLLASRAHIEVFDRVFDQVFRGVVDPADFRGQSTDPPPPSTQRGQSQSGDSEHSSTSSSASSTPTPSIVGDGPARDDDNDERSESILAAMSTDERLRNQSFAGMTPEELASLQQLMSRLALAPPLRRSRRSQVHRRGVTVDLRASMQQSLRTAGDPIELVRRRRRTRPRRLVMLCDISGSMEPFARAYLQLLHSAVGGARAEAFVFATRLTRVTNVLHGYNPDYALYRAGLAAPDWSGGTRIGHAIDAFVATYGRRGMARGSVVVIVSDGWEQDAPERLGQAMERLSRLAYRVIWVNPRKAASGYQPFVGGMAAALPHIDTFVSGHSLSALDELLAAISAK